MTWFLSSLLLIDVGCFIGSLRQVN